MTSRLEKSFYVMSSALISLVLEVKQNGETDWPAPGSEDTELRCLMEQEAGHGEATVYAGVQG